MLREFGELVAAVASGIAIWEYVSRRRALQKKSERRYLRFVPLYFPPRQRPRW